jgi:hypothetical protein
MLYAQKAQPFRPAVRCPNCNNMLFDGEVIKSRIIRVLLNGSEAKCRCKKWVAVPLVYR